MTVQAASTAIHHGCDAGEVLFMQGIAILRAVRIAVGVRDFVDPGGRL